MSGGFYALAGLDAAALAACTWLAARGVLVIRRETPATEAKRNHQEPPVT